MYIEEEQRERFQKAVGIRVRQLRKKRKWSRETLAEKALITDKYIYEIETGRKCMSSWVLGKVAKALDVSADNILPDSSI
jgi:ribosome-binding protein aMBF1 (putative translation factor)